MELTRGNIYKQLLYLSGPLVFGNILQQFYNTIDAWIIGRFAGTEQFAAVGVAGSAMNLFLFLIVGACGGISVVFAQLHGGEAEAEFRKEVYQTSVIGLILTTGLTTFGILLLPGLIRVLQTPENISAYVYTYLFIVLLGLPFSYLYNLYQALLRAVGNVKIPLLILGCAVLTNLCLDLVLVRGLGMGIRGAAIATVLSQILSAVLSRIYLEIFHREFLPKKGEHVFSVRLIRRTMSLAFVTGIHQTGLYIGKLLVQGAVNSCGTEMITAYTATTRIEAFVNSFGDSGAAATSVLVAQNYGAGNRDRVRESFKASAVLLVAFGLLCSVLLFVTSTLSAAFMLSGQGGVAYVQTVRYLKLVAVFYVFCFLGNTFAGYFDGIGKAYIPFIGASSHITMRVILSWMWIRRGGLSAVALATGIGWVYVIVLWSGIYLWRRKKERNFVAGSRTSVSL